MKIVIQKIEAFLKDTNGSASLEAALIFPVLLWAYVAMIVFWDAYKNDLVAEKATHTISDTLSRQKSSVDQSFLDGLNKTFAWLVSTNEPTSIRVTVVRDGLDANENSELQLLWSKTSGSGFTPYTDINQVKHLIPLTDTTEEIIIVHTKMKFVPVLTTVLPEIEVHKRSHINARILRKYCWNGEEC